MSTHLLRLNQTSLIFQLLTKIIKIYIKFFFYRPCEDRFMTACQSGELENVQNILDELKTKIMDKDANKWTGLHFASANGHFPIVEFLAANSADINAKTDRGKTALDLASTNNHLEICKFLVSKKCNVTVQMFKNAESEGHEMIVDLLKPLM